LLIFAARVIDRPCASKWPVERIGISSHYERDMKGVTKFFVVVVVVFLSFRNAISAPNSAIKVATGYESSFFIGSDGSSLGHGV
jgi:hypothetical protein